MQEFKKILFDPLFVVGLLLKLLAIAYIQPSAAIQWYVPFIAETTSTGFNIDPWAQWLSRGGTEVAFPYGYVMWLVFVPLIQFCQFVGIDPIYGYGITLLTVDIFLLVLFRKLFARHDHLLMSVYWLSPIILLATYVLGFNDILPVLFLVLALFFIQNSRYAYAGFSCVAAVSAKFSMILVVPFFFIYLFHNKALKQFLPRFTKGLGLAALLFLLPFILSGAAIDMLFSNPELDKVYRLSFGYGDGVWIYVVPLIYTLLLYSTWRIRRLNFELFSATLGMALLLVVILTPASPGWFVWTVPLLISYQMNSDKTGIVLASLFSILYVLSTLFITPIEFNLIAEVEVTSFLNNLPFGEHYKSIIHTMMLATGIILAIRIWRETVSRNDYFRLSRKPFVIGVAGDSGSGKDTLSDAITALFGKHSVAKLSGDDYHLWDRHKPIWQVMTHLNPRANDLESFANDLIALTDGKTINARRYDHETGRLTRPFITKSNDFIISSGLHALYLPIFRDCYNLKIYMEIDEGLRRHFKLQRDVSQRGHSLEKVLETLERRRPDSEKFIKPQAAHADLVLSLLPIHPRILEDADNNKHPMRYKLVARSRHGLNELSLTRILVGVCGLHVDMTVCDDSSEVELTIEGETSAQDIELAAKMICPRIFDFLDTQPGWDDGVIGLMQLLALSHINQSLNKRFIW